MCRKGIELRDGGIDAASLEDRDGEGGVGGSDGGAL